MNETPKTFIFVGVAAVVALLALFLRPAPFEQPRQQSGEKLFADLKDATTADALQIVRYDPDLSKAVELKIERDGDQWVIASHDDYPADASDSKERIRDVALKLMDLEVIDVASELTSEHWLFGVVSPKGEAVKEAAEDDIGMLVGIQDDNGKILAQLPSPGGTANDGVHGLTFAGGKLWHVKDTRLTSIDPDTGKHLSQYKLESLKRPSGIIFDSQAFWIVQFDGTLWKLPVEKP